MKKQHEKVLVAVLAGLVILSGATFAVQPVMAAGYTVDAMAQVAGVPKWDVLNIRKWPASYSQKIGALKPKVHVWVERCIINEEGGSDWCLVERNTKRGWVNSKYLTLVEEY
ncbi:MAG TPA: SH3 domain-containing protein [Bryobacteraceae bacterium]|nr:SH3 domain-containing protein [Bryobacteraceae bacterium]